MSLKYALETGDYSARSPDNPVEVVVDFSEAVSVTRQSMKDECDINVIMSRYVKTGVLSHVTSDNPIFADVSDVPDYRTAVERVKAADAVFNSLDAKVREKFANDTAVFLDAVTDPSRHDELVELGVFAKPDPVAEEVKLLSTPPASSEGA